MRPRGSVAAACRCSWQCSPRLRVGRGARFVLGQHRAASPARHGAAQRRHARRCSPMPPTARSTRAWGGLPSVPDLDERWAEATCGSLAGNVGQDQRLGRLPWKTLGLPDLRDGYAERLWYAVSTRYKGLLNCAASRACIDMTPAQAIGTITVRDSAATRGARRHARRSGRRDGRRGRGACSPPGPADHARRTGTSSGADCAPEEYDPARALPRRAAASRSRATIHATTSTPRRSRTTPVSTIAAMPHALSTRTDHQRVRSRQEEHEVDDRVSASPRATSPRASWRASRSAHALRAARRGAGLTSATRPARKPGAGRVADAQPLSAPDLRRGPRRSGWSRASRPHVLYTRAAPAGMQVVDSQGTVLGERASLRDRGSREPGSSPAGRFQWRCPTVSRRCYSRRRHMGEADSLAASP